MSEYYDRDRVDKVREIMPRFTRHARVGDHILFGLRGDEHFPAEFENSRPGGVITRVKHSGTENATLRVRTDNGSVVDVPAHNIDPRRVWEFTDASFEKVLARTQAANPAFRSTTPAEAAPLARQNDGLDDLRAKVDQLTQRLDREVSQSRNFNGALIASFNELAGEVQRTSGASDSFAAAFNKEYRSMMEDPAAARSKPVFDSDFSDSEDGM